MTFAETSGPYPNVSPASQQAATTLPKCLTGVATSSYHHERQRVEVTPREGPGLSPLQHRVFPHLGPVGRPNFPILPLPPSITPNRSDRGSGSGGQFAHSSHQLPQESRNALLFRPETAQRRPNLLARVSIETTPSPKGKGVYSRPAPTQGQPEWRVPPRRGPALGGQEGHLIGLGGGGNDVGGKEGGGLFGGVILTFVALITKTG
ncbi:hypothetical protein VC83_02477 [Pseudogymnoascus destructans]|uniref:Uncharacterized protein n=1 Tax=Pseudogymnoascus destructans TaxID=655981 RepID=A0A177AJ60_9PEZI|nr:uncharacterized protein VC83_02477 [Pseudogymnoascus destructans]OAF61214.1 hypothetical protein VC83_02477 [Pseudogymnoascus destructans]